MHQVFPSLALCVFFPCRLNHALQNAGRKNERREQKKRKPKLGQKPSTLRSTSEFVTNYALSLHSWRERKKKFIEIKCHCTRWSLPKLVSKWNWFSLLATRYRSRHKKKWGDELTSWQMAKNVFSVTFMGYLNTSTSSQIDENQSEAGIDKLVSGCRLSFGVEIDSNEEQKSPSDARFKREHSRWILIRTIPQPLSPAQSPRLALRNQKLMILPSSPRVEVLWSAA